LPKGLFDGSTVPLGGWQPIKINNRMAVIDDFIYLPSFLLSNL